MSDETTLILVRHAATESNLRRPYVLQGHRVDLELAPLGDKQADAVAGALADKAIDAVISSPLLRAMRTAERIAARHGLEVRPEPELREADVGEWENLGWEEIARRWPEACAAFQEDPSRHGYLGGESFSDVAQRALPVFERLAESHPAKTVVVVSHNVVNRALLAHWTGIPIRYARKIPQFNAGVNVMRLAPGDARVHTVNAAEHLAGLLPPA